MGAGTSGAAPPGPPAPLDQTLPPSPSLRSAARQSDELAREPTTVRDPQGPKMSSLRLPISGLDQTAISSSNPGREFTVIDDAFAREVMPTRIGRFAVLRRLGAGGMGVVYAGYDEELDRRVAIKVVREDTVGTHGRARMLREAQAMAKLSHPNVVQVYEVGELDDQVFVAMEFIRGKTLTDWLSAEERTWEEILEVFLQAGRGLAAAHRQGLVHRDFKPDNVLVDNDGRARVLDFGLARAENGRRDVEDDSALIRLGATNHSELRRDLTMVGTILGTPAFMSPEQHLGRPADARSDQFSFCVALYIALYEQAPFAGETLGELMETVTSGALRKPPATTRVPPSVFQALATGMATETAERFPSMDTLLGALSPETPDGRRRWLWPAALVGVSTLAVLITLSVVGDDDPTGEDLQTIDRLVGEARDAGARMHWVYPRPEAPRDTAYNRIILLENIAGAARPRALTTASGLRSEFAESLVVLGDRYFDDPASRPYARDYYMQALVFMPEDPPALERAGVTLGELADLRDRASAGEFRPEELAAAEPLRILADPDLVHARALALAYAADSGRGTATGRDRLTDVLRKSGLLPPGDAGLPEPEPEPEPTPPVAPPVAPPPEVPPPPEVTPPPVASTPGKPGRKGPKPDKPDDAQVEPAAEPTPTPEPDLDAAESDPEGSRALTADADAARRRGDTAAAEKLYNQALDLWNRNAAALMGLSDIYFERGDFDRAVKHAEKAVRVEPGNREYLLRLGDAYFKVFRYTDAQLRYERAAELGHPKADERLARVRAKLGG